MQVLSSAETLLSSMGLCCNPSGNSSCHEFSCLLLLIYFAICHFDLLIDIISVFYKALISSKYSQQLLTFTLLKQFRIYLHFNEESGNAKYQYSYASKARYSTLN